MRPDDCWSGEDRTLFKAERDSALLNITDILCNREEFSSDTAAENYFINITRDQTPQQIANTLIQWTMSILAKHDFVKGKKLIQAENGLDLRKQLAPFVRRQTRHKNKPQTESLWQLVGTVQYECLAFLYVNDTKIKIRIGVRDVRLLGTMSISDMPGRQS